jgi:hypothetical protein
MSGTKVSAKRTSYSRSSTMERMEKMMNIWIEDQNQRHVPVSMFLVQTKIRLVYEDVSEGYDNDKPFNAIFFMCDIPCILVYDCNNFTNTCTIHQGTHTAQHAPHATGPNLIKINTTNKQYTHSTTDTSSKLSFNNILKYFNHSFL